MSNVLDAYWFLICYARVTGFALSFASYVDLLLPELTFVPKNVFLYFRSSYFSQALFCLCLSRACLLFTQPP